MVQSFRSLVACVAWPALLAGCVATTTIGFSRPAGPCSASISPTSRWRPRLLLLERWMPHEAAWQPHDGQFRLDLGHTMVSNGTIQALLVLSGVIGLSALLARLGHSGLGLWPHQWPLAPQVALGLAVSEFAAYWAHRTAHEWEPLWYFHAIHHSVEKLWCVNSGRFHFVDALKSVVPGVLILVLAGAPAEVMAWLSALTGYIGIMTHTNVAMRFGPLNYVFNTPALHRWHHSMDLREGNKNYGENLVIWDLAFGTYFNAARRPPVTIGIVDPLPAGLVGQLLWPFRRSARALARGRLRDQQPTLGPAASGMPRSPSAVSH